ncbi:MAG: ABC transporter substrate-binding protein, partial [Bacillota bacterium]
PREIGGVAPVRRGRGLALLRVQPGAAGGARTLARETGARLLEVHPLETLTAADRQAGRDYLSLLEQNLDRLRLALGCGG